MREKETDTTAFMERIHHIGRTLNMAAILLFFAVAAVICEYLGVWPTWTMVVRGILILTPINAFSIFIEWASVLPILGPGATYLSYVTGNILNMKLPSIVNTMKLLKVEQDTEEYEILSVVSCVTSSLMTIVLLTVLAFLTVPLTPILEWQPIQPAFSQIMPIIYATMAYEPIRHMPQIAVPTFIAGLLLYHYIDPLTGGIGGMFFTILFGVVWAVLLCEVRQQKKKTE